MNFNLKIKQVIYYLNILVLTLPGIAFAQSNNPSPFEIKLISTMNNGDVLLRWLPTSYDSWQHGIVEGYQVQRYTVEANGARLTVQEFVNSEVTLINTLTPWPEADWEAMADSSDLAGLAASAMYGENFVVETADPNSLMDVRSVQMEKENRFGLSLFAADQSFFIAEAMGLAFRDDTALPNHVYAYNIIPVNLPDSIDFSGGGIQQSTDEIINLLAPETPVADPGDQMVRLSWVKPVATQQYTSFQIERSDDGGQTFTKRNDKPILYVNNGSESTEQAVFIDSFPTNGIPYIYRVKGITPFGMAGPASNTVQVVGVPAPLEADIYIWDVIEYQPKKHTIKWRFPAELNSEIQGFELYRSDTRDGEYKKIGAMMAATKRARNFGWPKPSNYYKIVAIDNNGHHINSPAYLGQIEDETPPAAPQNLAATVNPSGLAMLTWDPNTEDDIAGYRVFMSNQKDGEYTQVTIRWLRDTSFNWQLNLNTLSEKVYFKILALDHHENNSPFSDFIEVERPDIIPPAGPVLKNVEARQQGVYLEWDYSPSDDVVLHLLQRKRASETNWQDIHQLTGLSIETSLLDTNVVKGQNYVYRMLAEDEAGLQGSSRMFNIRAMDDGIRPDVINFQARIDDDGKSVRLSWNYPEVIGLYDFQVYRSISSNDPLRAYKSVNPDQNLMAIITTGINGQAQFVYHDEELHYGKQYQYKVMARFIDGGKSMLTDPIYIIIQ